MEANNVYSLFQWNTLCDKMCTKQAFPYVDESYLGWEYRKPFITKIISEFDSDFICLEEVDRPEDYINEIIDNSKYDNKYYLKDNGASGSAIFYKKDKFVLDNHKKHTLPSNDKGELSSQFLLDLHFKEKATSKDLIIYIVHLKAAEINDLTRLAQTNYLSNLINNLPKDTSLILCGDFNAEPTYKSMDKMLNNDFIKSAFNIIDKDKSNYLASTTFKKRDKIFYRVIDYIFYSFNTINILYTNQVWKKNDKFYSKENEDVNEIGFPSSIFPSDHFPLYVKFNRK